MKNSLASLWISSFLVFAAAGHAADFKQSKITEVVNDVQIISAADQTQKSATVNEVFAIPDVLRTGPASRAELVAKDETVTRVGANTIFSFDPASRTIDLQQGSLLFHSPHGKGGGSIHTGSATASVLGSTLIVCATHNGGFKVICLEDGAQIKLPNGLKQQLSPGQLTYILPGGQHLAPIVLFKLNDLLLHSLLVKGFDHPLASMPLILHEVNKQTKLIKSGRVTDTGLLAGDNASPDQVEVIDPNTIQAVVSPESPQTAMKANATLDQPSLTDPGIPTPPGRIFLDQAFNLAGNRFFAKKTFTGFAAKNILFDPADVNPAGLNLDLSPFANSHDFDFVAAKNITIANSVTFNGLSSQNRLFLIGGKQLTLAPNITLEADAGDFELATPGVLTMNGGNILNNTGDIGLTSGSTINILNGFINDPGLMTFTAANAINIIWDSVVFITGNSILTTTAKNGQVTLSSRHSTLTVNNTSIRTHVLTLNSGDQILLDASGRSLTGTGKGATANFTAPNLIDVKNADFTSWAVVNMAANTINLFNVAFGSGSVTLESLNGILAPNPNTGAKSVFGDVNFLYNVTKNGKPAQNYVNDGGGIIIKPIH
jgi:FecR protein